MQKIINVFAVASFVVSGAVVGSGVYVYVNRASILDGVKQKVMESVTGALPDVLGQDGMIPTLPDATGSVSPDLPKSPF
tara:strand:- start:22 stop:258 length:237 start_codon:yes stop_codon:yes gene_type:complete